MKSNSILFAYRVATICNVLFLFCLYQQRHPNLIDQTDFNAIIIILGWMVAPFLNLFVNGWYGVIFFKKALVRLPVWMIFFNLFLLIIQIYVYFILPI